MPRSYRLTRRTTYVTKGRGHCRRRRRPTIDCAKRTDIEHGIQFIFNEGIDDHDSSAMRDSTLCIRLCPSGSLQRDQLTRPRTCTILLKPSKETTPSTNREGFLSVPIVVNCVSHTVCSTHDEYFSNVNDLRLMPFN